MLRDFRYVLRRWARRPAVAAIAIVTLALGIGATTAAFSVVDAVLLRPLPWTAPDRLVTVWLVRPGFLRNPALVQGWNRGILSWPIFRDLQERSRAFDAIGVWTPAHPVLTTDVNEPTHAMFVSSSFLPMLGLRPQLGRFFMPDEDERPTDAVVISHETWQRRFGGSPEVLASRLRLDDVWRTVVGVLPPGFRFEGAPSEFLLPYGNHSAGDRSAVNHGYWGVARLRPGITLADALQDSEPIVRGIERRENLTARLELLTDTQLAASRRPLWTVLLAGGLLLLLACANVAALLLGEAGARQPGIALCLALGASRRRVLRMLLVESGALAVAGAVLGVLTAWWLTPIVVAMVPWQLPRIDAVGIDARVLAFSMVLTMGTVVAFGVGPALAQLSPKLGTRLVDAGREPGLRGRNVQRLLVVAEVTLAFVLLVGAGLLGETLARLQAQPTGLDTQGVIVLGVRYPRSAKPHAVAAQRQEIVSRLEALPGVTAAALVASAPFSGGYNGNTIEVEGASFDVPPSVTRNIVSPGYFPALKLTLLKGRAPTDADRAGEPVAVVSRELERRYLAGSGLDRRIRFGKTSWFRVIGVVADAKHQSLADGAAPAFYVLSGHVPFDANQFVLRTTGDPRAAMEAAREVVRGTDPRLIVTSVAIMDEMIAKTMVDEELRAVLSGLVGGVALVLTVVGLYGLVSRSVGDRTREIGVRMALGATRASVLRLVIGEVGWLVVAGLLVGLPCALAGARLLASVLYGVTPTTPHTFVLVSVVLLVVAFHGRARSGEQGRARRADRVLATALGAHGSLLRARASRPARTTGLAAQPADPPARHGARARGRRRS